MTRGKPEETCGEFGGRRNDGRECGRPSGWGTEFDSGKCRECRGTNPDGSVPDDHGAPEKNQNALRHGLNSDPVNLLEHLRKEDEKAYAWIQDKFESYLSVAPFGRDSAHADQLLQICVREYAIWKASNIQINDGVLTEEKKVAGEAVLTVDVENPASKSLDRMERTVIKRLEKLGVMPSPEQQEASEGDLRELWASDLRED